MLWWLEILAQYATSTGLAVLCIFVFWAYGLAFGSVYMRLLSGLLAAMLLTIAACPHGVDFAWASTWRLVVQVLCCCLLQMQQA